MDINDLVKVTSKAWALTILSVMHSGVPARQAPLLAACGASRSAFTQSLRHLVEIGMLERNPGHGHPLRPEYRLTRLGESMAAFAHRIHELVPQEDRALLRRIWTVPVLAALQTPRRFNEMAGRLPMISDRALSQSLKSMEDRGWVVRSVVEGARPPRPIYSAVGVGAAISEAFDAEQAFG